MKYVRLLFVMCGLSLCLTGCDLLQTPLSSGTQIIENREPEEEVVDPQPEPEVIEEPEEPEPVRNWTLAVYMAADNDLSGAADDDLAEMQAAIMNDNLTVLVLCDQGATGDSRLICLQKDRMEIVECRSLGLAAGGYGELNMGSPSVLSRFLDYAETAYPAQYTGLIIWGHGTGFRNTSRSVAIDDTSGTWITIPRLEQVLSGRNLTVLGFDTCFGTTLEQVYQLQNCAQFIAGSPGLTSVSGWDYTILLEQWPKISAEVDGEADEESPASVRDAAEGAARAMVAAGRYENAIAVDCSRIPALTAVFEQFSMALAETIIDEEVQYQVLQKILSQARQYASGQYPCDLYVDLYSLGQILGSTDLMTAVEETCLTGDGGWPGISVFFTAVSGLNVSVVQHPALYVKGSGVTEQCAFVAETTGWCPSWNHEEASVLDRLFY